MAGDDRPLDLGQDGVLEADHAGQAGLAPAEAVEQVGAELGLDRAEGGAAVAELAEGRGGGGRGALRGDVRHPDQRYDGDGGSGDPSFAPPARIPSVSGSGVVPLVSGADVEAAAVLLEDVVRHTPLWHSRGLADRVGGPVWLKCENLQRTGSFKIRGAYTRISRLTDEERARGVVAASAGNHAQGVALAARLLGCSATVFMPTAAPLPKVAATRSYGAEIRMVGQTLHRGARGRGGARRAHRSGVHPPVRAPGRDRRTGHRRSRGPRPVPGCRHRGGQRRRRRTARRDRGGGEGAAVRTSGSSLSRPRAPRRSPTRWPPAGPWHYRP